MAYRAFNEKYFKQMVMRAKAIKEEGKAKKAAKGKEEVISYAFMPDPTTGEHEFVLDRGIPPDALFKKLRTHANAERGKQKKKKLTKGSWGTCRIKSKTLFLTPQQTVPSRESSSSTRSRSYQRTSSGTPTRASLTRR